MVRHSVYAWSTLAAIFTWGGAHVPHIPEPVPTVRDTVPSSPGVHDTVAHDTVKSADGLQYIDIVKGTGKVAEPGKQVTVHYTGWLLDGTKFDSSVDRKRPFIFKLGAGKVIPGWDAGVKGMCVGGKRRLIIPPTLGYGARAVGPIPANSTLTFDVELLDVE